jgi:lipopolysaccharide export system protein LptC
VTGASGATWSFYTFDGRYEAYLTPGTYKFTISSPGYASQTWSVSVSQGMVGTGQNVYLEQNNVPVPEFSDIAVIAFSALAASVYLLRRRH